MFDADVTQDNLRILTKRGVYIAGPAEGRLHQDLLAKDVCLNRSNLLGIFASCSDEMAGSPNKKVLVTAGGTQEPLDPVRVLTNKSSGRQGYALAQAALDFGAEVTLITTPTSLTPAVGAR